jgi:hypothetical protein
MKKFDVISSNLKRYKKLANAGIMSTSLLRHFDIYTHYVDYIKRDYTKAEAISNLVYDFKLKSRDVKKILKDMEVDAFAKKVYKKAELRKALANKGYYLTGNKKDGYFITDKYTNTQKYILTLSDADAFLIGNFIDHCYRIVLGKIPPVNQ